MNINAQIHQMSRVEKLKTMEFLWTELRQPSNFISSPARHNHALKQREQDLENGDDQFINWEQAKKGIQNLVGQRQKRKNNNAS